MRSVIAIAVVALSLLSVAAAARAATDFDGYPDWAQRAFENRNGG